MDSELRHLFEAAADTLAADLRGFDRRRRQVVFPAGHLRAWMSAVNQTRVLLTELHGLEESDMQRTEYDPGSARDAALARVQLLGWLLETLVRHSLETG
jgi:tetraacyldisaccharide-1-P 4'-kinase